MPNECKNDVLDTEFSQNRIMVAMMIADPNIASNNTRFEIGIFGRAPSEHTLFAGGFHLLNIASKLPLSSSFT